MIRYVLHFCLVCPEGLSERMKKRWDKDHEALLEPLVDKIFNRSDCEVELTSSRAAELLKFLQKMHKEKARTNSPRLVERLTDDEKTPVE